MVHTSKQKCDILCLQSYLREKKEERCMSEDILKLTNPMDEKELEQILGGIGNGAIRTISHECNMNTWQFIFTCCS